jgi:selenocysteine lyase/cysteine desulfurase
MVYLDNAATTYPKPECVYDAVDHYNRCSAVNAGRSVYRKAIEATEMIRNTKLELLRLCNAEKEAAVVIAPSATVALNQIIHGQNWNSAKNAYVSFYEHNSVMRPLVRARELHGFQIRAIPHRKEDLSLDLEATREMFEKHRPDFVVLSAISNVTGYILPAGEILAMAKEYGAFTVLDAAQALGFLPMDFKELHADAIVFAGHKTLYSTFGAAGFFLRNGAPLDVFLTGGNGIKSTVLKMPDTAPEKFEAGSPDTPAIAGLQAALQWRKTVDIYHHEKELMAYLIAGLESIPQVTLYKAPGGIDRQGGVVSFNLEDLSCSVVGMILNGEHDIAVRTGHHCAPAIHAYLKDMKNNGTVRASISYFTTREEIDKLIAGVKGIDLVKARQIPPITTC